MGDPVIHDTRGGLRINARCQVMDMNGAVILASFAVESQPADFRCMVSPASARATSRGATPTRKKSRADEGLYERM